MSCPCQQPEDTPVPLHKSEIAKHEAEARKHDAEARKADLEAEREQILLNIDKRKEADELAKDAHHHVYVFDKEVTETSVKACINQLVNWHRKDPTCEIELQINSPGGSIFDGFALIDFLRDLRQKGHKVTAITYGMAASMAGVILQAADERVMGANALMLIHEGSMGAIGDFGKVEDRVALMALMHERILELFAERATVSKRFIKSHWSRRDWWLGSEECLRHGFIDRIA